MDETQAIPIVEADTAEWQAYSDSPAPQREKHPLLLALVTGLAVIFAGVAIGLAFGWAASSDDLKAERVKVNTIAEQLARVRVDLVTAQAQRQAAVAQADQASAQLKAISDQKIAADEKAQRANNEADLAKQRADLAAAIAAATATTTTTTTTTPRVPRMPR